MALTDTIDVQTELTNDKVTIADVKFYTNICKKTNNYIVSNVMNKGWHYILFNTVQPKLSWSYASS